MQSSTQITPAQAKGKVFCEVNDPRSAFSVDSFYTDYRGETVLRCTVWTRPLYMANGKLSKHTLRTPTKAEKADNVVNRDYYKVADDQRRDYAKK